MAHSLSLSLFLKSLTLSIMGMILGLSVAYAADKNTVSIGMTLEPPHLDPTASPAGAVDNIVYHNIFQGLTRINEKGEVASSLAKSWKVSEDGLVYRFFLKDGVKFHNGTDFDANDVVFSLDRARSEGSSNAQKQLFASILKVEAEKPLIARITLKYPNSRLTYNLAWGDAVMIDENSFANNEKRPTGTGAFRFVKWQRGQSVTLKRNDKYHGDLPKIENVVFRFLSDPVAAFTAVTTNEIDAFYNFPAPEQIIRLKTLPNVEIVEGTTEGETILAMNHSRKLFADKNMRLAIAHAINKQDLITGAMFGFGTPIGSHFSPHHPYYTDLTSHTPFDLKRAKEHLRKSGYRGEKLALKLPPPPYARRAGEIIAAQLRAIGINVEITPMEWAAWLQEVFRNKDYDLTVIAHTEPDDINIYGRADYYFGYDNPEFRKIMDNIALAKDEKSVKKLYQQAQKTIADDVVNVYLFQLPKLGVWQKNLKGLWQNSPLQAVDMTGVYWE